MTSEDSPRGPGLFSQTQIRHLMRTEFERAKRYNYPLTCMLIEIDWVGAYRDRAGFDSKEGLLDDLILMLRKETRTCDYLGRMLDDRFLLVLPHTEAAGAKVLAQRLQELAEKIAATEFHPKLSIGTSHFKDGLPMFFDVLLETAQNALESASGGLYVEGQ